METLRKEETRKQARARRHELKGRTLRANGLKFSAMEMGEGPEVVFCLHGFPDHVRSFREQMPALAEAGYRVIVPTLRGYEPSAQPRDGDYHLVRLAEDLLGWMDDLGVRKAHLVGHDWGAVIGYIATAMTPERFHSFSALAVAQVKNALAMFVRRPEQLRNSWYSFFFQLRGVSDVAVKWNDFELIEKLWRDWSPGWKWPEEEMAALKKTFRQPGVLQAALGYYRAIYALWSPTNWRTHKLMQSTVRVPTLALTGAKDGCMDTRLFDDMRKEDFPAGLRIERLQDAGHFLHQEKPAEINRLLVEWLGQH
ncbi:alpha/beta hydrolase [Archangium violaceum]|uniref:alpha/beta fold hydrolase n=1 Tax=Archangium violaceum TaxID=83451 RepID=UPI0019512AE3|nr:alpha/beta hydrolase [Archangium violaceum]QRN93437.1 alpha/beta hydrolase [Archangium violaceum]